MFKIDPGNTAKYSPQHFDLFDHMELSNFSEKRLRERLLIQVICPATKTDPQGFTMREAEG